MYFTRLRQVLTHINRKIYLTIFVRNTSLAKMSPKIENEKEMGVLENEEKKSVLSTVNQFLL